MSTWQTDCIGWLIGILTDHWRQGLIRCTIWNTGLIDIVIFIITIGNLAVQVGCIMLYYTMPFYFSRAAIHLYLILGLYQASPPHISALIQSLFTQPPNTLLHITAKLIIQQLCNFHIISIWPQRKKRTTFLFLLLQFFVVLSILIFHLAQLIFFYG